MNSAAPWIDYRNKDYASLREAMREFAREKLPEWTDDSPSDFGTILLELFAYMGDILLYYQDRIANESYLDTAVERRSVLNLLRLISRELRPPTSASADLTILITGGVTGTVVVDTGAEFQTAADATGGEPITFRYVGPSRTVELDDLPTHKDPDGTEFLKYEPLPVLQVDDAVSSPEEVLGSADGTQGQRFALARVPLVEGTLVVSVDEGAGPKAWELRQSLFKSGGADEHYVVRRDENDVAWVEFGDGTNGKIPTRARNNITATYLIGGGVKGNVAPNTITKSITSIQHLERVYNVDSAAGGAEHEPISDAIRRGPQLFRAMGRAVTARDYEDHAKEFGIGKARAYSAGWNRINLIVAPEGGGQPTDTLKQDLRAYFDEKRMMTALVEFLDPTYVPVTIEGTLDVEAYFFTEQVQEEVETAVRELLAFDEVDFGDTLYLSKVYEAIERVEGVAGVNIRVFARPDSETDLPESGTLRFGDIEIPSAKHPAGIELTEVRGGRRAG